MSCEPTSASCIYMNQVVTTCRLGLKVLKPFSLAEREESTGSMDEKMVPQSPLLRRNSVTEAKIKMVLSGRTEFRDASRVDIRVQSMISAVFITSLDAMLSPVILRQTFESPMVVYNLESDIFNLKSSNLKRRGLLSQTDQLAVDREKSGAPT